MSDKKDYPLDENGYYKKIMTVEEFRLNVAFLLDAYENLFKERKKKMIIIFFSLCDMIELMDKNGELTDNRRCELKQTIDLMFRFRDLFVYDNDHQSEFYYTSLGDAFFFRFEEKTGYRLYFKKLLYMIFKNPSIRYGNNAIQARIDFMQFILSLSDEDIKSELS